uniref:Uncharacterized protein n=1 Tax=Triticum urartu TaxID=4572 RepID=A0A8R7QMS2_TRIUA
MQGLRRLRSCTCFDSIYPLPYILLLGSYQH